MYSNVQLVVGCLTDGAVALRCFKKPTYKKDVYKHYDVYI